MLRKQVFRIIIGILAITGMSLILESSARAAGEYRVLHEFERTGVGGYSPYAGLTFDAAGNLYGTTYAGGAHGGGAVFELTPDGDGSWRKRVLHSFGLNGNSPVSGLIFDAAGNLYGTTYAGGTYGYGTVFKLTPNGDGSWRERVLHSFKLHNDGAHPESGLIFDAAGNLYGTTVYGGAFAYGTVFELTRNRDGIWVESELHSFNGSDGAYPQSDVTFDSAGNLYGMTFQGGAGTVFQLTPSGDGSWRETILHSFHYSDGWGPKGGLTFDSAGNLYGMTFQGGAFNDGTVFQLTRKGDGSWTETVLHSFNGSDGAYPVAGLTFDAAGNLYGTTEGGGSYGVTVGGYGVVFKLRPTPAGAWSYRVLHQFRNQPGALPLAGLVLDSTGNLYGTTAGEVNETFGSVFEITP